MTDTRWMNIDCGCLIFQYLAIPEAICLSRTNHFWYDLSSRRVAYRPMKFPSFCEGFDILEYRQWQECVRQPLALTPRQFLLFSTTRVIQHGLHDLELIVDSSPIHPDNSDWSHPSSIGRMERRFSDAISLYHSIQALTITIAPNLDPEETSRVNQQYVNDHQELLRILVSRLLTHLAPNLISLQIIPPTESSDGLAFAHRLAIAHRHLTMPNLLHAIVPVLVLDKSDGVVDDESDEEWYVSWETLKSFEPRGVLELSSITHFNKPQPEPARYWNMINMCPGKLINPPVNLILNNQHSYQALAGHSRALRSICIQLPQDEDFAAENYVSDLIPNGANYQEVGFAIYHTDELLFSHPPFTALKEVAHSLRILNLDFWLDGLGTNDYPDRLCHAAGIADSNRHLPPDFSCHSNSPFTQVTRVRITHKYRNKKYNDRIPWDTNLIFRICPTLSHLDLGGSLLILFESLVPTFPYQQLRYLTTPLPPANPSNKGLRPDYMMNIISKFRQLESLHLILDFSDRIINQDCHFLLLLLSSPNLVEVVFSSVTGVAWLTHDTYLLNDLNVWLMQLHLIWRMIQPTHTLPLDQISLIPITRVMDTLPLFGTFMRHPSHRLPYLRHRCQQQFDQLPQPPTGWTHRIATKLTSLIGSHLTSWFQSATRREEAAHVKQTADELALKQQRIKLVNCLSHHSQTILSRLAEIRDQFSSSQSAPAANSLDQPNIETRTHFRMIILEKDLFP